MAKKAPQTPTRDTRAQARAATLPDERGALLAAAVEAVAAYDAAVVACNDDAADAAIDSLEAVVWKLNGGTFFGSSADDESAGRVVARHCAAAPGNVPLWGQAGEFMIEVAGMRAVVAVSDGFSWRRSHLEFHAVDLHAPFISETGYRSHFAEAMGGCAVDEAARRVFASILKSDGRRMVRPESRAHCEGRTMARAWLQGGVAAGQTLTFEDEGGQICFAF